MWCKKEVYGHIKSKSVPKDQVQFSHMFYLWQVAAASGTLAWSHPECHVWEIKKKNSLANKPSVAKVEHPVHSERACAKLHLTLWGIHNLKALEQTKGVWFNEQHTQDALGTNYQLLEKVRYSQTPRPADLYWWQVTNVAPPDRPYPGGSKNLLKQFFLI